VHSLAGFADPMVLDTSKGKEYILLVFEHIIQFLPNVSSLQKDDATYYISSTTGFVIADRMQLKLAT
jgi:hypothetical protein